MNIQAPRDFIDRRQLVSALRALRRGDFSVRLPEEVDGVDGEIASLFNEVVSINEEMTQEFERLSKVVGKEGKISQRGRVKNARGGWETAVRSVNGLIEDMVQPTAEVARVIGAVAKGDLSQSMTVEIDGRPLRDLAFLADDFRKPLEFLGERLVHSDDFVEEAGDFAIDSVDLFRKANAEIAAAERTKGADQLAAVNKVARGLDIHSTLRVAHLPPAKGLHHDGPPTVESAPYQRFHLLLPKK